MVLAIDSLRVGSRDPPLATLDIAGNFRSTQDAMIGPWAVGSLGTGNAGLVFGGLPANSAAITQNPAGQTTVNSMLGQTVQFADNGVVGLRYSQGALLGNLVCAGGVDANTYSQTLRLQNTGLAANTTQALQLGAFANGQAIIDTRGASLTLASNGSPALTVTGGGSVAFANSVALGNLSASNVVIGSSVLSPLSNGVIIRSNCFSINQPNPVSGATFDCLGNIHVANGGVRIDGTATTTPDLSLGYPGTFSIDSSGVIGGRLFIDNNGQANIGGALNVNGPMAVTRQLSLAAGQVISVNGDLNHTLQFDPTFDGVRVQGFGGGVLGTSQVTANALAWTTNNVNAYMPLNTYAPVTLGSNTNLVCADPYISLARQNGQYDCVLAAASTANPHSNAAVSGDVVLQNMNKGNLLIQSSNVGPGIYINGNNAVGIRTSIINPLAALDASGPLHVGTDNTGSKLVNLAGKTFYSTLPTWRQLATFYANNNSGNGAQLVVRGPCGPWSGSRGYLLCTVYTSGGLNSSASWFGGLPSGVDVQVYTLGTVCTVLVQVTAAYATYNFDVEYGGQGFTSLAQPETTTSPTGTLSFSAATSASVVVANGLGVGNTAGSGYALDVVGQTRVQSLTPLQIQVPGASTINFGFDQVKEINAGRMGYGQFSTGSATGTALDVVGAGTVAGARQVRIYDNLLVGNSLSTLAANAGTLIAGTSTTTSYGINLATAVGAYTQICDLSDPQQASSYVVNLSVINCRSANATQKSYVIPFCYTYSNNSGGAWYRAIPQTNAGPANINDFAVDVSTSTSTGLSIIRVVRTGTSASCGTGLTATVNVTWDAGSPISLTYDGATGTGATNAGVYVGTPIGSTQGLVGINTANPAYPLDVTGSARVTGPVNLGSNTAPCQLSVNNLGSNTGMYFEGGTLTGAYAGGTVGTGWSAINFNGYYSGGEVVVNPARSRWRIVADQRTVPENFTIDQYSAASGSKVYLVCNQGNVGICQGSPMYPLDVGGASRTTGQVIIGSAIADTSPGAAASVNYRVANVAYAFPNQNTSLTNSLNQGTSQFVQHDYNVPTQTGPYPGGRLVVNDSNFSTDWRFQTKTQGVVTNPMSERLTITGGNNGYVGINQPVPSYQLDVNGTSRFAGVAAFNANINLTALQSITIKDPNHKLVYDTAIDGPYLAGYSGGKLATTTNSVNQLIWNTTGVGIQCTPAYPLDVNATGSTVRLQTATVFQQNTLNSQAGYFVGSSLATNQCAFLTYNSPSAPGVAGGLGLGIFGVASGVTVSPSGQVGINTTTPSTTFEVNGNSKALTLISNNGQPTNAPLGNAAPAQQLFNYNYGGSTGYQHAIRTRHNGGGSSQNAIDFYTWQQSDGQYGVANNVQMSVTSTGVGIGNQTNPAYQLDVNGTARFRSSSFCQVWISANGAYSFTGSTSYQPIFYSSSIYATSVMNVSPVPADITVANIWSNTYFVIPVTGLWHFAFDGTVNTAMTLGAYWTVNTYSLSPPNQYGLCYATGATTVSSSFTAFFNTNDLVTPLFLFGSNGNFPVNKQCVKAILIQRM